MRRKNVTKWMAFVLCTAMLATPASTVAAATNQTKGTTVYTASKKSSLVSTLNYERNFKTKGTEGLKKVSGSGTSSVKDGIWKVQSGKKDTTIVIDENSPNLKECEIEMVFDPANDMDADGMYGIVLRYTGKDDWTFIGQKGNSGKDPKITTFVMMTADGKEVPLLNEGVERTDGQRVYAGRKKPYTLKVRVNGDSLVVYLDHAMIYTGTVKGMSTGVGKAGVLYKNNAGASISKFQVRRALNLKSSVKKSVTTRIQSDKLVVAMDRAFPRVYAYRLKENNQTVRGQEKPYYVVEINNVQYKPAVKSTFTKDKVTYHLSISQIGVSFDVVYSVKENVLTMEIKNVKETGKTEVKTINFPEQSMVSMRSTDSGASLHLDNYITDKAIDLAKAKANLGYSYGTTSIATLSNHKIAATINNNNINNRQEIAYKTKNMGSYTSTGLWTNEFQYKGLDGKVIDKMWTKVAITADRNKDNKIDFQDAAIARRDDIGTKRLGSDMVQNSYSMIAMDVGSIAQYPFLRILDNIKKFNAGTDGFGSLILIKGYQGEGHDANHPDFANISERAGGEEDLKILLNEAEKYNAKIGFHINHTEAYPEAKPYSDDLIAETDGWTWYDDSKHIIRENDILNQKNGLNQRLEDLKKIVGNKLSFIYVDTYQDSRWQASSIQNKIKELGWALGTEYSEDLIKESVWGHTITDTKLEYNKTGNLVRFVDNETKDIFVNSPLFRGLSTRNTNSGFFGWQNCFSYDVTIEKFFTEVLPQKYLANFPVSQWTSDKKAVLGKNNEVVTKLVQDVNQITKDGKLIANGNQIFIPWNPETEEKIYHWNEKGGSTTWELPDSWSGLANVKLYQLTDEGRTNETTLEVKDGKVTIDAKAKMGYVVYKGTNAVKETDMTSYNWGQGSPVKDMGFDSYTFGYAWNKESKLGSTEHITFEKNAKETADELDRTDNKNGNTHLHVEGALDGGVAQQMTGLVAGQTYSASAFMEGNEGRKLSISVTTEDGQTVTNYIETNQLKYGCPHNDRFSASYQRVKVLFTVPAGTTTATIRLNAASSGEQDAWANFDNVRVTKVGKTDLKGHDYLENFENVDQEFGPFICTTKSTQSHLSEKNGNLTKDVIDGRYSLKIRGNGNTEAKFNHFRTAAHTLRLKPNTTYKVGFDYMATDVAANQEVLTNGETLFKLEVKSDKKSSDKPVLSEELKASNAKAIRNKVFTFTTGNADDYYIDLLDETYAHEFVMDNFYVDEVK